MVDIYKKWWRTAFDIGLLVLTVYLIMSFFSFAYQVGASIILSLIIFLMINPLADFLNRRGLNRIISTSISMFLFIFIILGVLFFFGAAITSQILNLTDSIPKYALFFQEQIIDKAAFIQDKINALSPEQLEKVKEYSALAIEKISSYSSVFLTSIFTALTTYTTFFGNLIVAIILAFVLSLEINTHREFASKNTPKSLLKAFEFLKKNVFKGISAYLKTQMILIFSTFLIVLISLLILGVENALGLSLLAAILDILPLLGISVLFVPWIIYLFFTGNVTLGIWLTVVWIVIVIFRQIAEPKLTGDSLGVSAYGMLCCMILSLSFFGIAGMILSPVILILLVSLYKEGYLKKWIHVPQDELATEIQTEEISEEENPTTPDTETENTSNNDNQ